jgi:hypothetical protein
MTTITLSSAQSDLLKGNVDTGASPLLDSNGNPIKVSIIGEPTKITIPNRDTKLPDTILYRYNIEAISLPLGVDGSELVLDKISSLEKDLSKLQTLCYRMGRNNKYQFTI